MCRQTNIYIIFKSIFNNNNIKFNTNSTERVMKYFEIHIYFFSDLHENIGQSGGSVDCGQTPWFRVLRSGNTFSSKYMRRRYDREYVRICEWAYIIIIKKN